MVDVEVHPISVDGESFMSVQVKLPKTTLLTIQCDNGYVMCGALDILLLRTKLADRGIVAARATGVRTMEELLNGTVESCTQAAETIGIEPGLPIKDALLKMKAAHNPNQ